MVNFESSFNQIAFEHKSTIVQILLEVCDTEQNHFSRYALRKFYNVCGSKEYLDLDKICMLSVLNKIYSTSSIFILDYDKPYNGGYAINVKSIFDNLGHIGHKEYYAGVWDELSKKIFEDFVLNDVLYINSMSTFIKKHPLLLLREPKNKKEHIVALNYKINSSGLKYWFFDKKNVVSMFKYFFNLNIDDFILIDEISSKNVKKYVKRTADEWQICICVDFSAMEKQLDAMYLEMPDIFIEIITNNLNTYLNQEEYSSSNEKNSIYRVGFNYFMGSIPDNRIGNCLDEEEYLMEKAVFLLNVKMSYIKKYVLFIDYVIGKLNL